jgi:malate dehydrogenase
MSVAVVLGAGDLGGTLAHALARGDRFREIRLIDRAERVALGKALDISQAGPVEGFGTRVSAAADEAAACDATVMLLADAAGAPPREWQGDAGLDLLRRALRINARAGIVCAGPAAAWLVEHAVAELGVPRAAIVGSAPAALAAAVATSVALQAQVSPQHVELWLAGRPPDQLVVAWEEGSIAGDRPSSVLDAGRLARIKARMPLLWPPGVYALASAGARVAEGLLDGTRSQLTCFAVLDGEVSSGGRAAAVPVRFRKGAVAEIRLPALSPGERIAFENVLASRR